MLSFQTTTSSFGKLTLANQKNAYSFALGLIGARFVVANATAAAVVVGTHCVGVQRWCFKVFNLLRFDDHLGDKQTSTTIDGDHHRWKGA